MPSAGDSPLDTESEEEEGNTDIKGDAEEGEPEDLSPESIMIIHLEGVFELKFSCVACSSGGRSQRPSIVVKLID